jgi:hypothetical protein
MSDKPQAICRDKNGVNSVCVTSDNKIALGCEDGTVQIWGVSALNNRLSNMREKQAKLIDGAIERTKSLLFDIEAGLRRSKEFVFYDIPPVAREVVNAQKVKQSFSERSAYVFLDIVSKQCWQEIEKVFEDEDLEEVIVEQPQQELEEVIGDQPKKRKELEDGESNPAKKERLTQELITEKKE